ncbi:hypothetical protein [Acidicapsa acidisoli]|uniref:hypothetical protein n=1 Tax=Acidicapsa acidisoli TaxID=1615681 RepID=UPI0021E0705D|nr:hypothetical protein [Acidicapsa acidisoli]
MNRVAVIALLALCPFAVAQAPQLHSGSTVFIEPMDGYETYLAAAIMKKHVPVIVVTDKEKADFVITSTVSHKENSQPGVVINNRVSANTGSNNGNNDAWNKGWDSGSGYAAQRAALGHTIASISVVDAKTSQIVFAHSAGSFHANQVQKTAEDCAKRLKDFIDKSEKPKK